MNVKKNIPKGIVKVFSKGKRRGNGCGRRGGYEIVRRKRCRILVKAAGGYAG